MILHMATFLVRFANELTLGYLEQSGVTERLKRKGVTEVAINRPFEIWIETSADGWLREEAPG